ncbi:MAG TPA: hypothetical protein VMB34_30070, partial [Acetobacteraceae bacterium]|nr:hypothetical protein [Acetobacteraceae bacterium]
LADICLDFGMCAYNSGMLWDRLFAPIIRCGGSHNRLLRAVHRRLGVRPDDTLPEGPPPADGDWPVELLEHERRRKSQEQAQRRTRRQRHKPIEGDRPRERDKPTGGSEAAAQLEPRADMAAPAAPASTQVPWNMPPSVLMPCDGTPPAQTPSDGTPPAQTPCDRTPPAQTPSDGTPPPRLPEARAVAPRRPGSHASTGPSPGAGRRAAAGEAFGGKPGEIMPSVAWPLSPQRVQEVAAGRPP